MKNSLAKLTIIFTAALLMLIIQSCVKTRSGYTELSQVSDFVILTGSGTSNFKASNVLVNTSSPDTLKETITADLASANSSNGPITVTIGLDNSVIAAYNTANGTNFQPFPANAYKIVSTTINISGGLAHYGTSTVWIFQNQLDPSVSYILPIAITDGGGKKLTTNQNVIYYNVIGNPLAGNYLHSYYRWNGTADTTSPPNSTVGINVPRVIGPITATSVLLPEYYININFGLGTTLSFTNTNGVITNPNLFIDAASMATITGASFTIVTLKLVNFQIVGNASTHYAGSTFRFYLVVINSGGATRALINNFVKQ